MSLSKRFIFLLNGLLTIVTVIGIYCYIHKPNMVYPLMFTNIVAMGFPFRWFGKTRKTLITLDLVLFFLRMSWICWASVLFTFLIMYKRKAIPIVIIVILILLIAPAHFRKTGACKAELKGRVRIWKEIIPKWEGFLLGDGAGAVAKYKEFERKCPRAHNDWIEFLIERGALLTIALMYLFFFPLSWFKLRTYSDRIIWASYLILTFQTIFDFPLHRIETTIIAIPILSLVYLKRK